MKRENNKTAKSSLLYSLMKTGFPVLILFITLVIDVTPSSAQLYVRDTIHVFMDDTVALYSRDYEGDIQWQFSTTQPGFMNDSIFSDLQNGNHDTLQYVVSDSVIFFRAEVTFVNQSDSCLWYSDVFKIQVPESLPYIATITAVDSIEVLYNTPQNTALNALPKTTTIMASDSSWYNVLLNWQIEEYAGNVAGKYMARGEFDLPAGVVINDSIDSLNLHVSAKVQVLEPQSPQVKTKHPTEITSNYALLGGEIISDGGLNILEKGVLWDSTFAMDNKRSRIIIDDTNSVFLDTLKNLQPDTRYYVRAYAINAVDTAYGLKNIFETKSSQNNDSSFTVYFSNPYGWEEVYIHMAGQLKNSTIDSTTWTPMNVLNEDSVWYYMEVPAKYQWVVFSNGRDGTQTPVLEINNTAWYDGNQWYDEEPDNVGPIGPVTDVEGNQYETLVMGNQVWMAENLRTTRYSDGTPVDVCTERISWSGNAYGAYSWYNNDSVNYYQKGALYNWYAIVNSSGLCPDGWRMPNNADWNELFDYFETGNSHEISEIELFQEKNSFQRTSTGRFGTFIDAGFYWSKNEYSSVYGYSIFITSDRRPTTYTITGRVNKQDGHVVRCLKDRNISAENFIPEVKTLPADSTITHNSALLQGQLQSTGGSEILEYGFYYDTRPDPQINGEKISFYDETGLGNFAGQVPGLIPNRTYYYRVFAKNKRDEAIGYQHHFKTKWAAEIIDFPDTLNYLYNTDISVVLDTLSDSLKVICTDDDEFMIPVAWSIDAEDSLEIGNNEIIGTLSFPDSIENPNFLSAKVTVTMEEPEMIQIDSIVFAPDTLYYTVDSTNNIYDLLPDTTQIIDINNKVYNCYVSWLIQDTDSNEYLDTLDAAGTIHLPLGYEQAEPVKYLVMHSNIVLTKNLIDYDGNTYQVVKIGNQLWMAENLKSTHYANGNPISESYYYNNDTTLLNAYGCLYTWDAVMNGAYSNNDNPGTIQGVCPDGWHVPSQDEWEELIDSLGGIYNAGAELKSTQTETGKHPSWKSPNTGATNQTGFNGLPGGKFDSSWYGSFSELQYAAYWWSSTAGSYSNALYIKAVYNSKSATLNNEDNTSGMSVRCVKDSVK